MEKKKDQSYLRTTKVGVAARFLFEITVGTVIWYFGEHRGSTQKLKQSR
jgi:hypothetical protein